jgi:GH24 family phage-related lysozyme (muramidase)
MTLQLRDFFRFYKQLPHQDAAIAELQAAIAAEAPNLLDRNADWYKTWQAGGRHENYGPALKLIKQFEGCHLEAYADPLHGWKVPTIGYGTTRYPDGRKVEQGDKITVIEADQLLDREIDQIAQKLRVTVPFWDAMSTEQRSALISFAYNLGSGFYGSLGFETISRRLREKDWAKVPDALLLYRNPGSNVEAGLRRRREAEGKLWLQGMGLPAVQQEPARLTPKSPFSARITPNIQLGEFALNQEARRFDHQHQVDTAAELAAFLERARQAFGGKPVIITSGYRPPAINRSVGGASGSEHLYDAPGVGAVDWYIEGVDIYELQAWCIKHWRYSTGKGAPRGFIHSGIRKGRPKVVWDY